MTGGEGNVVNETGGAVAFSTESCLDSVGVSIGTAAGISREFSVQV